jgi:hypothetical protein
MRCLQRALAAESNTEANAKGTQATASAIQQVPAMDFAERVKIQGRVMRGTAARRRSPR